MSEPQSLVERLKKRKLVQWAVAYLAGAWLLLQVLDLLRESFEWSPLVQRYGVVVLGIGFFAALVVAWYHGEKREQKVGGVELLMLAGILVIAGTGVAFVDGGLGRSAASGPAAAAASVAEQGSIAVLPFVNMSDDKAQEYFSDGLTEELLNVLAQLPELRVASRTSAFAYKGKDVAIDSIARALRVAHVLEGSVRSDGERIRITAQLIKADDGYHVWSDTYDRELKSVFAVQDEIARAIVSALRLQLGGGRAGARLAKEETGDPEAHVLLLKGLHLVRQGTREGHQQAGALLRQAIEHDPGYARAYALLAANYSFQAYARFGPREEMVRAAKEAAARALELDPELADAHYALGGIARTHDWDFRKAEEHYRRAIELNPGHAHARSQRAWLLVQLGRVEEAIAEARRGTELDPISWGAYGNLAAVYTYTGQFERALEADRAAVALNPESAGALGNIALSYSYLGRHAEAIEAARSAQARSPQQQFVLSTLAYVNGRAGRRAEAEQTIRSLEAQPDPSPYLLATAYAGLGETERVFAHLERAVEEKDAPAPDLGVDPTFDPFRNDPRMRSLLDRMGLP